MLKLTSGILVTLVVAVACGSPKKKDDDAPAPSNGPVAAPQPTAQSLFKDKLTGHWQDECESKYASNSLEKYGARQVYEFTADSVINTREVQYAEADCKTEDAYITVVGKYSVGDKSEKISEATAVTAEYQKITITPKSDALVKIFNDGKKCGISDWKIDDTREVSYSMSNCAMIKNLESYKDQKQKGYFIINDNVMKLYTSEYDSTPDVYKK